MKKKSDSCFCGLLLSCFRWKRFRSSIASDAVQPEVPQDRQNEGTVEKTDVPQPTCDDNVVFFAYSVCRDSWMFALHKEQQKNKLWTSLFWIVWLFAAIVFFAIAFFVKTNFRDFICNNWGTILLFIILILIGLTGLYYWHEYRNLNKWFNHYQSMLKDLDESKETYLECTKDDKNRMSSFINKYRYDKYLEQARKQQQKKTSCWKKLKALMPFSDI